MSVKSDRNSPGFSREPPPEELPGFDPSGSPLVPGGQQGEAAGAGKLLELLDSLRVVGALVELDKQVAAVLEKFVVTMQLLFWGQRGIGRETIVVARE